MRAGKKAVGNLDELVFCLLGAIQVKTSQADHMHMGRPRILVELARPSTLPRVAALLASLLALAGAAGSSPARASGGQARVILSARVTLPSRAGRFLARHDVGFRFSGRSRPRPAGATVTVQYRQSARDTWLATPLRARVRRDGRYARLVFLPRIGTIWLRWHFGGGPRHAAASSRARRILVR